MLEYFWILNWKKNILQILKMGFISTYPLSLLRKLCLDEKISSIFVLRVNIKVIKVLKLYETKFTFHVLLISTNKWNGREYARRYDS